MFVDGSNRFQFISDRQSRFAKRSVASDTGSRSTRSPVDAGVSKGAVSYALNGRPGVSEETRARILDVAQRAGLGPQPHRPDAVRLADRDVRSDPGPRRADPGQRAVLHGVRRRAAERALHRARTACCCSSPPLSTTSWCSTPSGGPSAGWTGSWSSTSAWTIRGSRRCAQLEIPAVFVGDPSMTGGFTTVWTDDTTAMDAAIRHLVELGHRRLGRVAGPAGSQSRPDPRRRLLAGCRAARPVAAAIVHADFSEQAGRIATRRADAVRPGRRR